MKYVLPLILVYVVTLSGCMDSSSLDYIVDPETRRELVRLMDIDQQIRKEIMAEESWLERGHEMVAYDSVSTAYLKHVVDEYGWPDSNKAGKYASHAAFLLVQHSPDYSFQEYALELMTELLDDDGIKLGDYALLFDRVRVHNGEPQLYGSQAYSDSLGYFYFNPIEDSANINVRREKMGMMPFEDYIAIMKQSYKFK